MAEYGNDDDECNRDPGCTCPSWDSVACIRGTVYGYCSSDACGGVCETEGLCACPLHADPKHQGPYARG